MPALTIFGWLFVTWGLVTAILAFLLIRRGLISMKEDDQLFLDPAEAGLEREQQQVLRKLDSMTPYLRGFGLASGALLAAMIGLVTYQVARVYWTQ